MSHPIPVELETAIVSASFSGSICIAYSGGLDSRFLAFVSQRIGLNVRLFHISGPHIALDETQQALDFARDMGLSVTTITINPLEIPEIFEAGINRCYICKKGLFSEIKTLAAPAPLCDGTNASDSLVFRPGAKALEELGIRSPLKQAHITKDEIRTIARAIGMPQPDQAARPCLLTRFPYSRRPTIEELKTIAAAESIISHQPSTAHLRFRLRFPAPDRPELHIEAESAKTVSDTVLLTLQQRLQSDFVLLKNLKVILMHKLSGFYDTQSQCSAPSAVCARSD